MKLEQTLPTIEQEREVQLFEMNNVVGPGASLLLLTLKPCNNKGVNVPSFCLDFPDDASFLRRTLDRQDMGARPSF